MSVVELFAPATACIPNEIPIENLNWNSHGRRSKLLQRRILVGAGANSCTGNELDFFCQGRIASAHGKRIPIVTGRMQYARDDEITVGNPD